MTRDDAIGNLNVLKMAIREEDLNSLYKTSPKLKCAISYAIRAIEDRERMKEALRKISDRLKIDETNIRIRDGGPILACILTADAALAEAEKE